MVDELLDISSSLIPDLRLMRRSRSSSLILGAQSKVMAFVNANTSNAKAANTTRYNLEKLSCTNEFRIEAQGTAAVPALGLHVSLIAGFSVDVLSPQH